MNIMDRFANAEAYEKQYDAQKMTQREACLDYLERYGSITPLEALTAFHSFRLAALICILRKDGYAIKTELNKDKRYAVYTLIREGAENEGL